MIGYMPNTHQQLHELESQLIEIYGLMEALQVLLPDGAKHTCVANALEDRLRRLQQQFYMLWDSVVVKPQNQGKVEASEIKAQS